MLFIVYSEIDAESIGSNLGMPEYSYYFVQRGFLGVLQSLGEVVVVKKPAVEVDPIYRDRQQRGQPCVFISFSPPNKTLTSLSCPTVCVFAWEFSNIPYEVWDDDPRQDWRAVLAQLGCAITLSTHTEQVVKQVLGEQFRIAAIPVPVYVPNASRHLRAAAPQLATRTLTVNCTAIENRFYEIGAETFVAKVPPEYFHSRNWQGERIELDFKVGHEDSGLLGGFYEPEPWGTWSRIADPWVLLPFSLAGRCKIVVELNAYGPNVGAVVQILIGGQVFDMNLSEHITHTEFTFDIQQPANLIQFVGLNVSGVADAKDPRSMGIGLRRIWIERDFAAAALPAIATVSRSLPLTVEGVVYTSVFNPGDDRKNWQEMLTGFCYAFRQEPRATLILKMTHRSVGAFLGQFHYLLQRIGPVQCRVIILHGYLDDSAYQQLIDITTYGINSSRCEGLCLPLMEFMSCGVPAVAPCHTAMQDYITADNAFIVDSSLQPGIWPHDPRGLLRTLRYRLDWSSLVEALRASFRVALEDPARYRRMSVNAETTQRDFSGLDVVRNKLCQFFDLDEPDEVALSSSANAGTAAL